MGPQVRMGQMTNFLNHAVNSVIRSAFPDSDENTVMDPDVLFAYIRSLNKPQIEVHFTNAWASMRAHASRARKAPVRRANSV